MQVKRLALLLTCLLMLGGWTHGVSTLFNGGKAQLGLNFLSFQGEFGYLNHVKMAQAWNWNDNAAGGPGPDMLTTNGYPIFQTTYLGNACGAGGI